MTTSVDVLGPSADATAREVLQAVHLSLQDGVPVLVEGPMGSGVTRIVDEVARRLRRGGVTVEHVRAHTDGWVTLLTQRMDEASATPMVFVCDDVHRVGPGRAALAADLLRRPRGGVAVVLAGRSGRVSHELLACVGHRTVALADWTVADVLAAYPHVSLSRAEELIRTARGRAAFVRALTPVPLLQLRELHRLPIDVVTELVDLGGFCGFEASVFQAGQTRLVAAGAAVLGDSVDLTTVGQVCDLPDTRSVREAVLLLIDAQLLAVREGRIVFAHPVLRSLCYAQLDPASRQELHARAARLLDDPGAPGRLAQAAHLSVAAGPGDRMAIAVLTEAARECLATSPGTSERWARSAIRLAHDDDRTMATSARSVLGSALAAQGRIAEAAEVAKELARLPAARCDALLLAARCERIIGRPSVAAALVSAELAARAEGHVPGPLLMEALSLGVVDESSALSDTEWPAGHALVAALLALVRAESTVCTNRMQVAARAQTLAAQVSALSNRELTAIVEHLPSFALACLNLGLTDAADRLTEHAAHLVGSRGDVLVAILTVRAAVDIRLGRLALGQRRCDDAAELAKELGLTRAAWVARAVSLPARAAVAGPGAVEGDDFSPGRDPSDPRDDAGRAVAEAYSLLGGGDPAMVASLAVDNHPSATAVSVEGALERGALSEARGVLGQRPTSGTAVDLARWLRASALVELAAGELDHAVESARSAVGAWVRVGWPLDVGRTRLVLAEALRRRGDFRDAEREVGQAKAGFQRMGAVHLVSTAVGAQKRIAAGQARGLRAGEFGLSSREAEIARLVCSGLTNRDIAGQLYLSVRTVDSHVAKVLTKVGVSTRVALASMFAGIEHLVA